MNLQRQSGSYRIMEETQYFLLFRSSVIVSICQISVLPGNRYLLAFSLKRNYDILTYDRSKPRTDDRMKDVACIEGIRCGFIFIIINKRSHFSYRILLHRITNFNKKSGETRANGLYQSVRNGNVRIPFLCFGARKSKRHKQ